MSAVTAVSAADFEKQVLQSDVPVLVDFWATWCPPCRRIGPEVDAVAEQFDGKAKVFKVDIDAEPELSTKYDIKSLPALFIFKDGKVVEQLGGFQLRKALAARLEAYT